MVVKELMRHERRSDWEMQAPVNCLEVGRGYGAWEGVWMSSGSVEKEDEWREIVGPYDLG